MEEKNMVSKIRGLKKTDKYYLVSKDNKGKEIWSKKLNNVTVSIPPIFEWPLNFETGKREYPGVDVVITAKIIDKRKIVFVTNKKDEIYLTFGNNR